MSTRSARARSWWRAHPLAAGLALAALGACDVLQAQGSSDLPGSQPSIYTCVDPRGRRITSDRPIPECMDSEQRELTPRGNLKRTLPPALTAEERARESQRLKEEADRQARLDDERRKNRALLTRYPDQAAHDKERAEALAQLDGLIAAVRKRAAELERQQQGIGAELEFYQNDPARAPLWLRRKQEENARQRAAQAGYLADQLRERQRTNARFDEELQRLRGLWKQEGR
ncbi:MAG: hypothetical protein RJA36_665 [Pseudomonadota bacterium]|jgi:hypothetical protein